VLQRLLRLAREVDLAFLEALQEIVGRQIDQLDLVGLLEDRVGHGLAHDDAGDLGHHVVQALDVLHVDGGVDVDAGVEQLDHVLPAFGVPRARRVGVGEFVDQDDGGSAEQGAVQVELGERGAPIVERPPGQDLESGQERVGLGASVGLDVSDDHVDAVGTLLARGFQHRVRLAHAGRRAEKHLQLSPTGAGLLFLDAGEERLGIGPVLAHELSRPILLAGSAREPALCEPAQERGGQRAEDREGRAPSL